ncbi:MAG: hypothetical protein JO263_05225 [Candidatus Eremiobacteraeota bacterium]|nr:hypothetical protein [Candidatus Eremiobacteraeota bacterium]
MMLFGGRKRFSKVAPPHAIATVRDIAEVVAIVAAGIWAFYIFAYENRIKPSLASPDVNVTASIQRLSQHNGLMAITVHLQLHNIGTVRAHFLGFALNVYGQRIVASGAHSFRGRDLVHYDFDGFYRAGPRVPVYSYAYITHLGNPSTAQDTYLDPGSSVENDRTFYVPYGRFDLLIVGIDAPYTKFEDATMPAHLHVTPRGDASVVVENSPKLERYSIVPLTSLDVR